MYVKWQTKRRSKAWYSRGDLLTATLVECHRIDGRPRQKVVSYLGSVRLDFVDQHLVHHLHFWDSVSERLDRMGERIDTATRRRIERKLSERVTRPNATQRAKLLKDLWHQPRPS